MHIEEDEGICSFRWPFRYICSHLATHVVALTYCCLLATFKHIICTFWVDLRSYLFVLIFRIVKKLIVVRVENFQCEMKRRKKSKRKNMFQCSSVLMKVARKERKK